MDNNSTFTDLRGGFRTPSGKDSLSSELDHLSTLDTATGNLSLKSNQDFFDNQSSPIGNVFNNSLLLAQPHFLASVSSQPLSSQSTTSNSTTDKDLLTGSTQNTPLVGITSNDSLIGGTGNKFIDVGLTAAVTTTDLLTGGTDDNSIDASPTAVVATTDLLTGGTDDNSIDVGHTVAVASTEPTKPVRFEFPQANQPLVGIIDTGFSADNPNIDYSHISSGHDYIDGDNNSLLQPGQGDDHGTQMLGIIAGINNTTPIWLGRAVGSGHWADSLVEFVNHAKELGQPHAVVNLSFDLSQVNSEGSVTTRYELTPQEHAALVYAQQNHVLIVAAAGNQGGAMSALGQASQEFNNIITVGATDGMNRAAYSSYGEGLDLLADSGTIAGTSAATAKVTGAVSLVWAANPELSYRQVIDILEHTATDLNTPSWDAQTGFGLLNLAAAVDLAQATVPTPAPSLSQQVIEESPQVSESSNLTTQLWQAVNCATPSERPNGFPIGPITPRVSGPLNLQSFRGCVVNNWQTKAGLAIGGGTLLGLGQPTRAYPRTGMGSSTGATSPASEFLSRMFPQRPGPRFPAPTLANPRATTPVVGRALGRWVPMIGGGLLAVDAALFGSCLGNSVQPLGRNW